MPNDVFMEMKLGNVELCEKTVFINPITTLIMLFPYVHQFTLQYLQLVLSICDLCLYLCVF